MRGWKKLGTGPPTMLLELPQAHTHPPSSPHSESPELFCGNWGAQHCRQQSHDVKVPRV